MASTSLVQPPKYRQVHEALLRQIVSGRVPPGGRLPSEADLVQQFGASRITVARALRELQLAGLIERRAGSGSFVCHRGSAPTQPLSFGVLIPDFGEVEIFTAVARGLMDPSGAALHGLVWGAIAGGGESQEIEARQLCAQYVARRVDGVFFAPLEHAPARLAVNRHVAQTLADARIPLVLLDRSIEPYPTRGHHDLIALDNRRAGALVTSHLLAQGCRRAIFLGLPGAASSVDARAAGFRDAVLQAGLDPTVSQVWREDPADRDRIASLIASVRPDAFVCASDRTAAILMHTLLAHGVRIPDDLRMVGIDDVSYAGLLPVPLTTLRQPCREIGAAAVAALRERVARPDLPPRDILLHGTLVVRESCGASTTQSSRP
jgi:GntR family transcriptional regulator, arabinose operon transcriptional repressor